MLSCVQLSATLWTVALQASLSMGFSRQEHWSGFPFLPPAINSGVLYEKEEELDSILMGGGVLACLWYVYVYGTPN